MEDGRPLTPNPMGLPCDSLTASLSAAASSSTILTADLKAQVTEQLLGHPGPAAELSLVLAPLKTQLFESPRPEWATQRSYLLSQKSQRPARHTPYRWTPGNFTEIEGP